MSPDLNETITRLLDEHGRDYSTIANALNAAGTKTRTGRRWTRKNVGTYVSRNLREWQPRNQGPRIDNRLVELESHSLTATNEETVTRLLVDNCRDIESLLTWWKAQGGSPLPRGEQRPIFRGPRRNTGVHVSAALLERAAEKAQREKARTGGSLSRLVELLLWRYCGEPADVIEQPEPAEPREG